MAGTPTVEWPSEFWHFLAQHMGKTCRNKTPVDPSRQDQPGEDMSTKLYVGNLSHETTETQLQTLFSEAGEVTSAKIITDRQTGQPRGFGFVEMETKLEGQKAISMLNGRDLDGRPLTVNEAKPQQKGGFGGGGYRH
jgi:RNA recognition motif-containing protein